MMIEGFASRHLGLSADDVSSMLESLSVISLDALMNEVIPDSIRIPQADKFGAHSEAEALQRLRAFAEQNKVFRSYIGTGYHNCHTPSVLLRNILENPAWYTAYTPYQPEISQGRLEALLIFQMMVADLTGLDIANASLLDEATAAAEAMALCYRLSRGGKRFFVSADCLPQTIAVLQTRAQSLGIELLIGDLSSELSEQDCFGGLLAYPGASGEIPDLKRDINVLHDAGAKAVVTCDLLSLLLLESPGDLGADIAVGSSQRFGVPMFCGGPHAAFFAARSEYQRSLPGRLIGVSIDANGDTAFRMALQTREQHIRRDKATSNICTAQALLAIMAAMYAVYHGPEGLRQMALRVHSLTSELARQLARLGYTTTNGRWFDTLTIRTGAATGAIHRAAQQRQINFRCLDDEHVGVSLDETTTISDVEDILSCFSVNGAAATSLPAEQFDLNPSLPAEFLRQSKCLQHPVFFKYRTETEMQRFLRKLADKDLALDRTMIPLGSCTMKLNAATEMIPVSWPEFANIHPHAPTAQRQGYLEMIRELEAMLCRATGYDAVSLQPNAGSQGEYAGLLAIQAYHASRGESDRNICLIPASAHGTNPASATLAGMRSVVIKCDEQGNVDVDDLRGKAGQHRDCLAAMMLTYPSTHGVFEENVGELCEIVHNCGGQVYIDGANLNAQVGLCQPGKFGGDVSHLNLHKTFCIPHGGGGPGVGPVAVRKHLADFLPGDPTETSADQSVVGPVSAAPWGSAGILPISWSYIYMMGDAGLRRASELAILNANYIAARLAAHYPILYTGANGRIAHECIIDLRPLKDTTGIQVEDIAKRLMDYGFHAPTMSFPVPGTMMIEPTESESKAELDRFCEAMISIRKEIQAVEEGVWSPDDNPLVNAPHTAPTLLADVWDHCYPRQTAAYPAPDQRDHKYWVPVGRVDQTYGDRNLFCSCPNP
ncbi:MAG: aminomethyl-transferring glycine dehydrogenase [Planctomycetota bacterium]